MIVSEIENFLAEGLKLLGLALENQSEAVKRLTLYFQELRKWNKKINLVARDLTDQQILENHFLDSLTLLLLLKPENLAKERVLDVGTGAGFPGLVLKTVCPALPVVLVEPRLNRYYFLKHIIRMLALKEIEVLPVRLGEKKEATQVLIRRFSFITSRAFTDIKKFVSIVSPYLDTGGRIVCMKGPGAAREMDEFGRHGEEKFSVTETKRFQLPFSKAERMLVVIKRLQ